ncbi:hypothetical protein HHI36_008938 [Cryptolaemus montrouzieri]|uniref:Uncharacterized protein n=1 Tax=Cryptolaemus montrouzieri TaxID=559131 RepID=A0ABD2MTU4_9CUCU
MWRLINPNRCYHILDASIPHNINDNVTEAEDVEINETTIAVAHDATDNAQIAPSAIDSDASDAEDIGIDQPVIASTKSNDKSNKPTTTLHLNFPLNSIMKPTKNANESHMQTPSRSPSAIESVANIDNLAKINRNTENIRGKSNNYS